MATACYAELATDRSLFMKEQAFVSIHIAASYFGMGTCCSVMWKLELYIIIIIIH